MFTKRLWSRSQEQRCRRVLRAPTRRFLGLALFMLLIGSLSVPQGRVYAATPCRTSNPVFGAYSVQVCIDQPADGANLAGPTTVSATITVTGSSPGMLQARFYLDGEYLLTDYQAPYRFELPTDRWLDGSHLIAAEASFRDSFVSQRADVNVSFNNNVTETPVNPRTFTPSEGTSPPPGQAFVLAAAGDGASGETSATSVTNLIGSWNPNMFLYLGDVYDDGTATEFYNWYGQSDSFYGRFRAITNPAIGNHEYQGFQAPGYFDYWDNIPHYYSFDVAGWHFISLDSTSQYAQTTPGTGQYAWLQQDLEANTARCTVAFFHHPAFNVGQEGESTRMPPLWSLLAGHGVDLVLTGHDHSYQRWVPLDANGSPAAGGATQLVVGTGGHGIQGFLRGDERLVTGFDTSPFAMGALRLELNQDGAAFRFVNTQNLVLDSGSVACDASSPDTIVPSAPANLSAGSNSSTHVDLTWSAGLDNVGVTGYNIYRNGVLLTSTSNSGTTYTDRAVAPAATYQYQVRARDAAGNLSSAGNVAVATTRGLIFSDGFESGNFSLWSGVSGLTRQQQEAAEGAWAARATTSGGAGPYAHYTLGTAAADLYYRVWFKIISQGANSIYVQRFRTATNGAILSMFVSQTGKLGFRNDVGGVQYTSTTSVSRGSWHELQTRVRIAGSAGETQVWLDGVQITSLSKTEALGASPVGRIHLGDNSSNKSYDIAFDSVALDTRFIESSDDEAPSAPASLQAIPGSEVRVNISWSAAVDDVGVGGYDVYRNGSLLASTVGAATSYADTTVAPATTYEYTVRARDLAGNVSAASVPVTATTPPDQHAPTATLTSPADGLLGRGSITLAADAEDNYWVERVDFLANGVVVGTVSESPFTIPWDSTTVADGQVMITARVADEAGNMTTSQAHTVTVDNTPGATTIDEGPSGFVAGTTASFAFSSSEVGASFSCSLDAAPASACSSPQAYSGLSEGSHTFRVTGTDPAGNPDPGPATRGWTVDTIDPAISTTVPGDGSADAEIAADVRASFSEAIDAATLTTDNFTLVEQGTTTPVAATVSYDPATNVATLQPDQELDFLTTYIATITAGSGGPKDLAGNMLAIDKQWSFTTVAQDTTQPSVTLTAPTAGAAVGGTVILGADATDDVAVDRVEFFVDNTLVGTVHTAPYSFSWDASGRADGSALIAAHAIDTSGNTATSAGSTVIIDNTPPEITIGSRPPEVVNDTTASFAFSSSEVGTSFSCSLDAAPASVCGSPLVYSGLSEGSHTFSVTGADPAGNLDPEPATYSWTIDTTAPIATSIAPSAGAIGVPTTTQLEAIFSEAIDAATLTTDNFTLVEQGTTTPVAATVTYDSATRKATLTPDASLPAARSFEARLKGGNAGVKDVAGNALAVDRVWNFTTADASPPTAPTGLSIVDASTVRVSLSWNASTDNIGVTGYTIYRDGALLATVGAVTSFADLTVAPQTSYSYQVRARDAENNQSPFSTSVTVTTPPRVFEDGFESACFGAWSSMSGLTCQTIEHYSGAAAGRGTTTNAAAYAYKLLSSPQTELYYRVRFKIISQGSTSAVYLLKFRTNSGSVMSGGTSLLGLYVAANSKLYLRNDIAGTTSPPGITVSRGTWHDVQLRTRINPANGAAGESEVWYDGVRVDALSTAQSLGTTALGRIQLGENSTGKAFDIVFDDVSVDTHKIAP